MKIFKSLFFFIITLSLTTFPKKLIGPHLDVAPESVPTLLDIFCSPISFTDSGFKCYIKHRYNRPEYSEFLSLSFNDMLQFLRFGKQQPSRDYAKRIFGLFNKKLKSSSYINAFSFEELLAELPELATHYFQPPALRHLQLKKNFQQALYSSFLNSFEQFKKEPDHFLDELAYSLTSQAIEDLLPSDQVSEEELRTALLRFLEQGFSKLVWSPEEKDGVWDNVKAMSNYIYELVEIHALQHHEDLDDLFWSLISRFGYFIEISGHELPVTCYQKIFQDIETQELLFLSLEEQEDYVEPKKEYLMRILKKGIAKAQAHSFGF